MWLRKVLAVGVAVLVISGHRCGVTAQTGDDLVG